MRLLFLLILAACGRSFDRLPSAVSAPTGFSYPQQSYVLTRGVAIMPIAPVIQGDVTKYGIVPLLPPGLTFDSAGGVIAGTPTETTPAIDYTLTASNDSGTVSVSVSIRIGEQPPAVSFTGFTFVVGELSTTGAPPNTGGPIAHCDAADSTLEALSLEVNPQTCEVRGYPTATAATAQYPLTITYADGTVSANVTLTVNSPLHVVPAHATMPGISGEILPFGVSGGAPPYHYVVTSGPGAIDGSGVFTATADPDTNIIAITDSGGRSTTASIDVARGWVNGPVYAIGHPDKGGIMLGGDFTRAQVMPSPRLVAVDLTTGKMDHRFDTGTGLDGVPSDMLVARGALYVAGDFLHYNSQPAAHLARILLPDGTLDTNFTLDVALLLDATSSPVLALASSQNHLLIAGSITAYRGVPESRLIAVDLINGHYAMSYDDVVCDQHPTSRQYFVEANDTTVVFGETCQNNALSAVTVLSADTLTPTATRTLPLGTRMTALNVVGGNVVVGTSSSSGPSQLLTLSLTDLSDVQAPANVSQPIASIAGNGSGAVLYTDGGHLEGAGFDATDFDLPIQAAKYVNGDIYVGGPFAKYGSQAVTEGFARLNVTTGLLEPLAVGLTADKAPGGYTNASATAFAGLNGILYVGGDFIGMGGVERDYYAHYDPNDVLLPVGDFTLDAPVYSIVVDTYCYIGGAFSQRLLRYVGTTDSLDQTFAPAPTGLSAVYSLSVISGVGTPRVWAGGVPAITGETGLYVLSAGASGVTAGVLLSAQPTLVDGTVRAIAVTTTDQHVWVGGDFPGHFSGFQYTPTTITATGVTGFLVGTSGVTGFDGPVLNIAKSANGGDDSVCISGAFHQVMDTSANGLVQLSKANDYAPLTLQEGALDGDPAAAIYAALNVFVDGQYIWFIGGSFERAFGVTTSNLVRLVGGQAGTTIEPGTPAAFTLDAPVHAFGVSQGRFYVGGEMTSFNGQRAIHFVMLDPVTGQRLE